MKAFYQILVKRNIFSDSERIYDTLVVQKLWDNVKNHNFDFPPIVFSSLAVLENCTLSQ